MSSKASVSSPTLLNPTALAYGDYLLLDGTRSTLMELFLKNLDTVGLGW